MHYQLLTCGQVKKIDDWWVATNEDRTIARDHVKPWKEEVLVSTVFLMVDHNYFDNGPPILFETMIFGGLHDEYQVRYRTKDEALQGHRKVLQRARWPLLHWLIDKIKP